jgi:hypothetical protein
VGNKAVVNKAVVHLVAVDKAAVLAVADSSTFPRNP